jgi:dCTP deaminase
LILKEKTIRELIEKKEIEIEPIDLEYQLETSSISLRLSNKYYKYPKELEPDIEMLDARNPYFQILEHDFISEKGFVIEPNKFIIAESLEYIKVPENIAIFLDSKFRLNKIGLQLLNTGWIEAGYEGNLLFCLYNVNDFPVRIFSKMRIAEIVFSKAE